MPVIDHDDIISIRLQRGIKKKVEVIVSSNPGLYENISHFVRAAIILKLGVDEFDLSEEVFGMINNKRLGGS